MGTDKLRIEDNERVDVSDFTFLSGEMSENHARQIVDAAFTDPNKIRLWILSGFAISNPSANEIMVTKGRAILARRDAGVIRYGALTTEGDATKTIDINSYSNGTYGIYIRFEYVPGSAASRIFWNNAGDGAEYAQTINTRDVATWNLVIESTSPGAEWMKIGEVVKSGGAPAITDQRRFYFEGEVHNTYQSGWGSVATGGTANDRNSDRQQYGVFDLQTALAATRQCLEDIKGRGLKRWWDPDIGGMNIGFNADPVSGQLAIGAATHNFELASGLDPTWNLDSGDSLRFDESADELIFKISAVDRVAFDASGIIPQGTRDLGSDTEPWQYLYSQNASLRHTTGDAFLEMRADAATDDAERWRLYANDDDTLTLRTQANAGGLVDTALRITRDTGGTPSQIAKMEICPSRNEISFGGNHDGTADELQFWGDMIPMGSFDLGKSGSYWPNGYITSIQTNLLTAKTDSVRFASAATPNSSGGAALGTTTLPWSDAIAQVMNVYSDDPVLTFTDTNGTAHEKTQLLKNATDQFLISGVTDASVEEAHLTFVKNSSAQLTDLIFGDTGAPIYKIRPHADLGGNLGDNSYRWNNLYTYGTVGYRTILNEDGSDSPYLELNDEGADDEGTFRISAESGDMIFASHQFSTPANRYSFLEALPNAGTAYDYEILDVVVKCVGHFRVDDASVGIALKRNTSAAYGTGYVTYTGNASSPGGSDSRAVVGNGGGNNTGYLKIWIDGNARYLPFWSAD